MCWIIVSVICENCESVPFIITQTNRYRQMLRSIGPCPDVCCAWCDSPGYPWWHLAPSRSQPYQGGHVQNGPACIAKGSTTRLETSVYECPAKAAGHDAQVWLADNPMSIWHISLMNVHMNVCVGWTVNAMSTVLSPLLDIHRNNELIHCNLEIDFTGTMTNSLKRCIWFIEAVE